MKGNGALSLRLRHVILLSGFLSPSTLIVTLKMRTCQGFLTKFLCQFCNLTFAFIYGIFDAVKETISTQILMVPR